MHSHFFSTKLQYLPGVKQTASLFLHAKDYYITLLYVPEERSRSFTWNEFLFYSICKKNSFLSLSILKPISKNYVNFWLTLMELPRNASSRDFISARQPQKKSWTISEYSRAFTALNLCELNPEWLQRFVFMDQAARGRLKTKHLVLASFWLRQDLKIMGKTPIDQRL